jgi:hypothetical protein
VAERRRAQPNAARAAHDEARMTHRRCPQKIEGERRTRSANADPDPGGAAPNDHATRIDNHVPDARQDHAREYVEGEREREMLEIAASMAEAGNAPRKVHGEFQVRQDERELLDGEGTKLERLVELEPERAARHR